MDQAEKAYGKVFSRHSVSGFFRSGNIRKAKRQARRGIRLENYPDMCRQAGGPDQGKSRRQEKETGNFSHVVNA